MRTPLLRTGQTSPTNAVAHTTSGPAKSVQQTGEVPFGPSPTTANRSGVIPGLLAGLAKPVIAAVMMAGLFSGPAIAQGAPLDVQPTKQIEARELGVRAPLADAYSRLAARNNEGGSHLDGAGWGNELEGIDPLARAVYDYVDFTTPRGNYSLWGGQLRGVYSEGGLGVGFTLRPKIPTGYQNLSMADLKTGVGELDQRLSGKAAPADQGTADLDSLRAGGLKDGKIYQLTEALLDHVQSAEEAKERKLGKGVALLTHAELLDGLEAGSDLHTLAKTVLQNQGWSDVLGREMSHMMGGLKSFSDATHIDDGVTHYVLLLGKRAQQAHLLHQVQAGL